MILCENGLIELDTLLAELSFAQLQFVFLISREYNICQNAARLVHIRANVFVTTLLGRTATARFNV